ANNFLGVLASQVGRDDVAVELLQKAIQSQARIPEFHNNLGLALQSLGRKDDAEASFRQAIRLNGRFPEACNNLGTLLQEKGHWEEACQSFERALALKPDYAEAAFNAGNVHARQGKYEDAVRRFKQAIKLRPDYAKAHCGLGSALQRLSQPESAEQAFRRAIELQPGFAEAHTNLAVFLRETGRLDDAESAYRKALELNPRMAEAKNGLGELCQLLGKLEQAESAFLQAIALKPDYAEAYNNLGVLLAERGRLKEALESYRKALAIRPDFVYALNNMGIIYAETGRLEDAMECYHRALEQDPSFGMAYSNLGNIYRELGQVDQARASYEQALAINPDGDVTRSNLGTVLMVQGKLDEAKMAYQRAMAINPANAVTHSNLIFSMDFDALATTIAQQAERKAWNERYAAPLRGSWQPHGNVRDPDRRLRIGYVSADFRLHSAAYGFAPLLLLYDHENFEVFCYSNSPRKDQMTKQFVESVDAWREVYGMGDDQLAMMVREDRIDLLVDLSGHSSGNRLLAFAMKPAPVQLSGWGYGNGTGLEAMDYLISDAVSIPLEEARHYSEKVVYLSCLISYACPQEAPPIVEKPDADKEIIFGCFNKSIKWSEASFDLWSEILKELPGARLLLKAKGMEQEGQRARVLAELSQRGIAGGRVELMGGSSWYDHMAALSKVDISLDPVPYSGGISTFESLWMGVPVLALCGKVMPGRSSASILASLGLSDWVAATESDYIRLAVDQARNRGSLTNLRKTLRDTLTHSASGNQKLYMHQVEQLYRKLWLDWCRAGLEKVML
ncbi:MAG TPA: tetratricopeptide repeat protein, partial [Novimethylophilus sp.]|uniref:tetratricopeptide repeat protein n=1 Tax=Novimethylophilus sp. TaxID=2137426 RepID=UPI002F40A54E